MEEELEKLRSLVETLREEMNAILADREFGQSQDEATRRDRETVRNLEERVRVLEENQNATSDDGDTEDGEEGDDGESVVDDVGVGPDETNEHVTVPDTFEFQSQQQANRRKSIDFTPELANVHQLHEFDSAPSVGTIHLVASVSGSSGGSSGSGQTVTLKLVDPDGNTADEDTSMKWMVPLRQADGNGKVLHWARIGNSVTFDVGSIIDMPCPPTIDATLSGNSVVVCVHSYKKVDGDCVETSGSPQCVTIPLNEFNLNCEDVRNCISGATETVVTDVFVSSGNLYKTVRTAKALEWGAASNVMIVSGTTCEEGGAS